MHKITAETANGQTAFEAEADRKLVLCLEDNGVDILHRCGGNARCTTCRVEILSGDPGEIGDAEKAILSKRKPISAITHDCRVRFASTTICTSKLSDKQASKEWTRAADLSNKG